MEINEKHEVDVPLMTMQLLVFIVGVIGNIVVIFVILILKEYKKAVTHWYVLQLAIADTLFLLSIPFRVVENWNDEWILSVGLCKVKETALFLNYYSSILFLMIMSMDRYIAVFHGLSKLQKLRTAKASYIIAAIVWLTAFLLCIPVMIYSNTRGVNPRCKCRFQFPIDIKLYCTEKFSVTDHSQLLPCMSDHEHLLKCTSLNMNMSEYYYFGYEESGSISYENNASFSYHDTYDPEIGMELAPLKDSDKQVYSEGCSYENQPIRLKAFFVFNFVVMFVIPLIVMTACYTLIAMRLNNSRARSGSKRASRKNSYGNRKRSMSHADRNVTRVTIICGILVLLFVVCWFPYHVVHLTKMTGMSGTTEYCQKIVFITSLLGYLNSALNPYLYNFIGTKFRRRLRSAIGTVRVSLNRHSSESMSHHQRNGSRISNALGSKIVKQKNSNDATSRTSLPDSVFVNEKLDTKAPLMTVAYDASNEAISIQNG